MTGYRVWEKNGSIKDYWNKEGYYLGSEAKEGCLHIYYWHPNWYNVGTLVQYAPGEWIKYEEIIDVASS